ncbi:MAG: hypothetical protein PVF82_03930 [Gammaproteobacteria bacterium]|jgi:hypothetical protein
MPKFVRKKSVLYREITVTLALKFLLIYFIWLWFFSNPVDEHLDDTQVQNAIFGEHGHPTVLQQSTTNRNPVEDN